MSIEGMVGKGFGSVRAVSVVLRRPLFWIVVGSVALTPCPGYGLSLWARADTTLMSTITTDTGDFAPGNRNFTRVEDPLQCIEAAKLAANQVWRTLASQTQEEALQLAPLQDTLPAGAVAVARSCGARFTVGDTLFAGVRGVGHLSAWFILSLWERDDSLSHMLVRRMLSELVKYPGINLDSSTVIQFAIDQYLKTKPAQLDVADSLTAQLDAKGRSALIPSLRAHERILEFADGAFNRSLIRREAKTILALSAQLTTTDYLRGAGKGIAHAMSSEMAVAAVDHPDSLTLIAQQLQQLYRGKAIHSFLQICRKYQNGGGEGSAFHAACGRGKDEWADYSSMSVPQVIVAGLPYGLRDPALEEEIMHQKVGAQTGAGGQAEPDWATGLERDRFLGHVTASYWFPAPGRDTVVPSPGTMSLIVVLPTDSRKMTQEGRGGYQMINMKLRRWLALYGASGLSVTVLAVPRGHALLGLAESTASLGKSFDWYYHEYLKFPVTVAVDTAPVILRIANPDGRVYYGPSAEEKALGVVRQRNAQAGGVFPDADQGLIALVDRKGTVVFRIEISGHYQKYLPGMEALLAQEFSHTPQS